MSCRGQTARQRFFGNQGLAHWMAAVEWSVTFLSSLLLSNLTSGGTPYASSTIRCPASRNAMLARMHAVYALTSGSSCRWRKHEGGAPASETSQRSGLAALGVSCGIMRRCGCEASHGSGAQRRVRSAEPAHRVQPRNKRFALVAQFDQQVICHHGKPRGWACCSAEVVCSGVCSTPHRR